MVKKNRRLLNELKTILLVGEGEHDEAFLRHMKSLYDLKESGKKIKTEYVGGGSPHDIIKYTVKITHNKSYDFIYILMDSDLPIESEDRKIAKKNNFNILQSEPLCLEGMLLDVLGEVCPNDAKGCKKKLHPKLLGNPTEETSYRELFDKQTLDNTSKATIVTLREVLAKTY